LSYLGLVILRAGYKRDDKMKYCITATNLK